MQYLGHKASTTSTTPATVCDDDHSLLSDRVSNVMDDDYNDRSVGIFHIEDLQHQCALGQGSLPLRDPSVKEREQTTHGGDGGGGSRAAQRSDLGQSERHLKT